MYNFISIKYDHNLDESEIYKFWLQKNCFQSIYDINNTPYTIIMPPPNVTGRLHMGHMLNNIIQDVLIRRHKMEGLNTCWVPSADHAAIATEMKIMEYLNSKKLSKHDIGRLNFQNLATRWSDQHIMLIKQELQRIGVACDWDRFQFTMDRDLSNSVKKVFIDLHNKKLIYRGYKLINWDFVAQTSISDEELTSKTINDSLYYIKYRLQESDEYIVIATTRPETIFGDVAVCIHPQDERYIKFHNKYVIVPIINKAIPIILDTYVDKNFGSGCLKVTPAHDFNDYNLAIKHDLNIINIFHRNGRLNNICGYYKNTHKNDTKIILIQELKNLNLLIKVEDYIHNVFLSPRTNSIVEPMLSKQWFLKLSCFSKIILECLDQNKVILYPNKFKNIFHHWIINMQDWNISRQLWWGHRIPVYYYGKNLNDYVVASDKKEAMCKIENLKNNSNNYIIEQDKDVLDTWFSSWILPISLFNGILNPTNKEFLYYYPSKILVTGPDIIFFWVIKMMIAGYIYTKKMPFNKIYFTGIIRDKNNNKMSKSLGNFPDTIDLIKKYGADAIRTGLLLNTNMGNDLIFNENICIIGKEFIIKFWNVYLLINKWKKSNTKISPNYHKLIINWLKHNLIKLHKLVKQDIDNLNISKSFIRLYKFFKLDFSSIFLEIIKDKNDYQLSYNVYNNIIFFYKVILHIFHPYIPFITEKISLLLLNKSHINKSDILINNKLLDYDFHDEEVINEFKTVYKIIKYIRYFRKKNHISFNKKLQLFYSDKKNNMLYYKDVIIKLCNLSDVLLCENKRLTYHYHTFTTLNDTYYINYNNYDNDIFLKEYQDNIKNKIKYYEFFLSKIKKLLNNKKFLSNAPKLIIEKEYKKEKDILQKIYLMKNKLLNPK
jgi:valyl-tRNA synthetase